MREEILLECTECKDCFIGTTHIDGCNCPRCGGPIVSTGNIEELNKRNKELEVKLKSARWNGDIKNHRNLKSPKPKLPPIPNNYIGGVDLSSPKDLTVKIKFNADEFNKDLIEKLIRELEDHKRSIGNYIQCVYE